MHLIKISSLILLSIFFVFLGGIILDDNQSESVISGKPFPVFQQKTLDGKDISNKYFSDRTVLVNIWASWCITCLVEHPFLESLAEDINIIGVNYKDDPKNASDWLTKHGNFFTVNIHDPQGNLAIDLGVTGAPESFLVVNGKIVSHIIGEMNQRKWEQHFAPNL
jgi:cytochrome c biogenesis protein CcmG/thiol:disulfide interchange protein DsbE